MSTNNSPQHFDETSSRRLQLERQIDRLIDELLVELSEAGNEATAFDIDFDFNSLLSDLSELYRLKESEIDYEEVLSRCPHWQHKVDQLRADQRRLRLDIEELYGLNRQPGQRPRVRRLLRGWESRFHEAVRRARCLVMDSFNIDTGDVD